VLEVLTTLGFLAQATSTIRLATGVLVLPLREPVAVARAAATVDVLSKGRLMLGVGAGWLADEFAFCGADYATRNERLDDAIGLLRVLWAGRENDHPRVAGARFRPPPAQPGGPPIIGGGESPRALRRAAALCDGWYGHVADAATAAERVETLRRMRAAGPRAGEPFVVTVRVAADADSDAVGRLAEAGVDRVVAEIGSFDDPLGLGDLDQMERFADRHLASTISYNE
jgi:probable F420-dependent oxidoreductase